MGAMVSAGMSAASPVKTSDALTLLDSTYVNVQPSGSGTFNITRVVKIQTREGAIKNHCLVYDYDPLTAFARFKYVRVKHTDGKVDEVDLSRAKDYVAPARAIFWGASRAMC